MSTVAFHFCKYNERAYLNREAHEDPIVELFAACANSLISIAREDKDLLAPSRQGAKFRILFSYLGAFASLREIYSTSIAALPLDVRDKLHPPSMDRGSLR
jgi:hypothetical protein